ncbi:hypothetical protein CR513_52099, partial [Mucuna pruriens]
MESTKPRIPIQTIHFTPSSTQKSGHNRLVIQETLYRPTIEEVEESRQSQLGRMKSFWPDESSLGRLHPDWM